MKTVLFPALTFVLVAVSCQKLDDPKRIDIVKKLAPATSESDTLLLRNPNRGWRMEIVVNVANIVVDGEKWRTLAWRGRRGSNC